MNTATATHHIHTTCALSIALLISGTANLSHGTEQASGSAYRQRYESFAKDSPNCAISGSRVIFFESSSRQAEGTCTISDALTTPPPQVRLARPLSGSRYIRSGENIRYSF